MLTGAYPIVDKYTSIAIGILFPMTTHLLSVWRLKVKRVRTSREQQRLKISKVAADGHEQITQPFIGWTRGAKAKNTIRPVNYARSSPRSPHYRQATT